MNSALMIANEFSLNSIISLQAKSTGSSDRTAHQKLGRRNQSIAYLSFAKSSCLTLKGFFPTWWKLFGLRLQADSSTGEKLSQKTWTASWPGYMKKGLVFRKWFLSLRCHRITMVQAAESRKGLNLAFSLRANCCRPTCWRVLRESKMSPVLVIIEQAGRHQPFEMPLIQDNNVVKQVASAPPNAQPRRSATNSQRPCELVGFPCPSQPKHVGAKLCVSVE